MDQVPHRCDTKARVSVMRIRILNRLSTQRSVIAFLLLGILVGSANAGAVVVCFGEDGHIEVVPAPTGHCCECPSNAAVPNAGHQCESCLDIPLPLGSGAKFLPPAGAKVKDFRGKAEYIVSSRSLALISPDLPQAPPVGSSYADHAPLTSLCTVVLLI